MNKSLNEIRHARSQKDFPHLQLEAEEYVELVLTRSKISLVIIWFIVAVSVLLLTLLVLIIPPDFFNNPIIPGFSNALEMLSLVLFILYAVILMAGFVATKVHFGNKLFVTNKRAIQLSTAGLFNHSVNIVELSRIEDVSFNQNGFIQNALNYGTIRMSTVGNETTYTFPFVSTPTDEIQTISHLIHSIKKQDSDS